MGQLHEKLKANGLAWLVPSLVFLSTLIIFILNSSFSSLFIVVPREKFDSNEESLIHPLNDGDNDRKKCDLFKGRWIKDPKGPRYTSASCPTIPLSKDCFLHGREDKDFLYWKWKPDECEISRFKPKAFFKIVRVKRLAFIGDSVARNQMESLLCLLSQEEAPIHVYKDAKDRSRTWFFPMSNFTLMVLWTRFLVKAVQKEADVYDLHLDQVDDQWALNVSHGLVDFAIVSDSQWFFKKNYLYEGGTLLGCIYCNETNVTEFSLQFTIGKAFLTALRYMNSCEECKGMSTLVRTISPSHFENGTWKTGGKCERSKPYSQEEASNLLKEGNKNNVEWEVRNIQMEVIKRAKREVGVEGKVIFSAMDITSVMLMRPDGHPGSHWRHNNKKGYNDCVHWCIPGAIDVWNDLLFELLRRVAGNGG